MFDGAKDDVEAGGVFTEVESTFFVADVESLVATVAGFVGSENFTSDGGVEIVVFGESEDSEEIVDVVESGIGAGVLFPTDEKVRAFDFMEAGVEEMIFKATSFAMEAAEVRVLVVVISQGSFTIGTDDAFHFIGGNFV